MSETKTLRDFLDQIQVALRANLYFLALMGSLAIPDICGAIDSDDGEATGEKYAAWYDKYAGSNCPFLDGESCYRLRCSILHQGSTKNPRSKFSRVIFVEPPSANLFHCNILNDALNLDIPTFCNTLVEGALRWLSEVEGTPRFDKNYDKFIRRYPNGLPPYIAGASVIS